MIKWLWKTSLEYCERDLKVRDRSELVCLLLFSETVGCCIPIAASQSHTVYWYGNLRAEGICLFPICIYWKTNGH